MFSRIVRIIWLVYPFILVGALIYASIFFVGYTIEPNRGGNTFEYNKTFDIQPNETFAHNVTFVYIVFDDPHRGYGSYLTNDSIVVENWPSVETLTNWRKGWLQLDFEVNETCLINRTIVGPNGIIHPWGCMNMVSGVTTGDRVEVTEGGTYRFFFQNAGSESFNLRIEWNASWQYFEKPYFYHGVAGLVIASIFLVISLLRGLLALMS